MRLALPRTRPAQSRDASSARTRRSAPRSKLPFLHLLEEPLRLMVGIRGPGLERVVVLRGPVDLGVRHLGGVLPDQLGDALVVAINSDAAVRALKGDGRPLVGENDRAAVLAALSSVGYVTIFDDLSPRSFITRLLPDVLVKGGDYALDQIHGREEVEAAGGRVISLPFVEGVSTSEIIERMKKTGQ